MWPYLKAEELTLWCIFINFLAKFAGSIFWRCISFTYFSIRIVGRVDRDDFPLSPPLGKELCAFKILMPAFRLKVDERCRVKETVSFSQLQKHHVHHVKIPHILYKYPIHKIASPRPLYDTGILETPEPFNEILSPLLEENGASDQKACSNGCMTVAFVSERGSQCPSSAWLNT